MNSIGRIFRVQIFGESHGPVVGVLIDGCPAGMEIHPEMFRDDLDRRRGGQGLGTTPRKEEDIPVIRSGVFRGKATGAPVLIQFENTNMRSSDYEQQRSIPRPGHADWVAHQKYRGYEDFRGGGHFSARLTTGLVAAGVIAKKIIHPMDVKSGVVSVHGESDIAKGLQQAVAAKDSVGGIIETVVSHMPAGLGEPFFDSAESCIAHMMFSIPAVKGIEFGAGFQAAMMYGSEHNDPIIDDAGTTSTNHAGGIVGGITNGNDLVFRLAIKPTSSTPHPQESWNRDTRQVEAFSIKGRHDLCVALRAPVIVEAVTAIVLADLMMVNNAFSRG